jgi:hypothetical protein
MEEMTTFEKLPITVRAIRYLPDGSNLEAVLAAAPRTTCKAHQFEIPHPAGGGAKLIVCMIWVQTPNGAALMEPGDWLTEGVAGATYPCKDNIFTAAHEETI